MSIFDRIRGVFQEPILEEQRDKELAEIRARSVARPALGICEGCVLQSAIANSYTDNFHTYYTGTRRRLLPPAPHTMYDGRTNHVNFKAYVGASGIPQELYWGIPELYICDTEQKDWYRSRGVRAHLSSIKGDRDFRKACPLALILKIAAAASSDQTINTTINFTNSGADYALTGRSVASQIFGTFPEVTSYDTVSYDRIRPPQYTKSGEVAMTIKGGVQEVQNEFTERVIPACAKRQTAALLKLTSFEYSQSIARRDAATQA